MTPISARSRKPISEFGRRCAIEQRARLVGREHRRLAFFHHVFRAAHGVGRVHVEDVAGHQPVEQHAQRRQVLLDRGRRELALQLLDERGDVERLHVGELVDAVLLAPLRRNGASR